MSARGLFVVLDGVDGCGKSTQAGLLEAALRAAGRAVLHVREPGTTALGESLRTLLLQGGDELDAGTEALLFAAARRHLLRAVIAPALAQGHDVVCERFHSSTFAYQGVAGGLGAGIVTELLATFADAPRPDLELILDADVAVAAARRGGDRDRIERRGIAFQERVAEAYRAYAAQRENARLVAGGGSVADVHARVLAEVQRARR
jgi:dTMP kinase